MTKDVDMPNNVDIIEINSPNAWDCDIYKHILNRFNERCNSNMQLPVSVAGFDIFDDGNDDDPAIPLRTMDCLLKVQDERNVILRIVLGSYNRITHHDCEVQNSQDFMRICDPEQHSSSIAVTCE